MRKINKNYKLIPLSLQPQRKYHINALKYVLGINGWDSGATNLYSGGPVKKALDIIYNKKCAYCEVKPLGSPAQVEHFRPKDKVSGIAHPGYYWLAYEWSNLLLSCGNCNTKKGNHFPIANIANRVNAPTLVGNSLDADCNFCLNNPLKLEAPELINPEFDDPTKHLIFSPKGKVLHLSARGQISIQRYDLNREELYVEGRMKIIDKIVEKILKRLDQYKSSDINVRSAINQIVDILIEDIINPIKREESFTQFYKTILIYFKEFIIDCFPENGIQIILKRSYSRAIKEL